jgi:hypothetical protein
LIELTALLVAVDVGLALLTLLLGTVAELVAGAGLLVTGPYRAEL